MSPSRDVMYSVWPKLRTLYWKFAKRVDFRSSHHTQKISGHRRGDDMLISLTSVKCFTLYMYTKSCYTSNVNNFFNVYLFLREREREHEWGRGRERGRHRTWRRLWALSCQHRAQCRARTHQWWDHNLSRSWKLSVPTAGGPSSFSFITQLQLVTKSCYLCLLDPVLLSLFTAAVVVPGPCGTG